jgi:hypothetical protein
MTPELARNWTIPPASLVIFHGLGPMVLSTAFPGHGPPAGSLGKGAAASTGVPASEAALARPPPASGAGEVRRIPARPRGRACRTPRSGTSA